VTHRLTWLAILLTGLAATPASTVWAYPLDAAQDTGIHRLEAFYLARETLLERGRLVPGALLPGAEVVPRMLAHSDFALPTAFNPELVESIKSVLGGDASAYGISLLDLTDPAQPRYAELNGTRTQNPASVGKIMVALGFFQVLADVYPDDVEARQRLLKNTMITANEFIVKDTHTVPVWKPGDPKMVNRPIEIGDQANLYTFLDWMCSASSNAAAAQLQSELILLQHFGKQYPVSAETAKEFFDTTPQSELTALLYKTTRDPLSRNGLDPTQLRQGGFFTRTGKSKVPGTNSVATARELTHYLLLAEQGKLVDEWSSREIKRLLYFTERRIRYASSPVLDNSAVYYKSGSLYSCKPEAGFTCEAYMGNRYNFLNSIAIIETHDEGLKLHYIVSLVSNVLKKNSAWVHREMAGKLHQMIEDYHKSGSP
jgi:hypothetical protein